MDLVPSLWAVPDRKDGSIRRLGNQTEDESFHSNGRDMLQATLYGEFDSEWNFAEEDMCDITDCEGATAVINRHRLPTSAIRIYVTGSTE